MKRTRHADQRQTDTHIWFCYNLKKIRTTLGMTAKDVAELMGITRQSFSDYERGRNSPSLDLVGRFSVVLNVPVQIFFQFTNEETDFTEQIRKFRKIVEDTKPPVGSALRKMTQREFSKIFSVERERSKKKKSA